MATISIAAPAQRRTATPRSAPSGAAAPRPVSAKAATRSGSDAVPLRLTRRGRRLARTVIVLMALLTALVLSVTARSSSVEAGNAPAEVATTTVVVQPGQTLWTVARTIAPNADVRDTVARIQHLNGISGSNVRPGQQLVVPVVR
jgi:LysM repeat protein